MAHPATDNRLTTVRLGIFVVGLAVALTFILFPFDAAGSETVEGDPAPRTFVAPRPLTYTSEVLTEQARATAAERVEPVVALDPAVRDRQLVALATLIEQVDAIRARQDLTLTQRQEALARLAPPPPPSTALTILEMTPAEWATAMREATRILGSLLDGSVSQDQVRELIDSIGDRTDPRLTQEQAAVVRDLVAPLILPNLVVDEGRTAAAQEAARSAVRPVRVEVVSGQVIALKGEPLEAATLETLEELGLLRRQVRTPDVVAVIGVSALASLFVGLAVAYLAPQTAMSERRLALLALLVVAMVLAAKLYLPTVLPDTDRRFLVYLLPVASAPMVVAVLLGEMALAVAVAAVLSGVAAFTGFYLPGSDALAAGRPLDGLQLFFAFFLGSTAGVYFVGRAESANRYLAGALAVFAATLAAVVSFWLLDPARGGGELAWILLTTAAGALLVALTAIGGLVLLSVLFGITTRVQLMELVQLSHPLLRRLQEEAPGTYQHSVVVANLAERAATLIGADALLVRTGAYYHDSGKLLRPSFYIENQMGGPNPHDDLNPVESAHIVAEHVRGGLELAQRARLPAAVRAFIPEHHGTRLVTYFYRKAAQQDEETDPALFRYPGPRPQSRETALVMLADSVEAVVRSSPDRSPERIDDLVDSVLQERVLEGQLDDTTFTLRDLALVARSFKATLRAVYHPRIPYPEPTPAERRRAARMVPLGEIPGAPSIPVDGTSLPERSRH